MDYILEGASRKESGRGLSRALRREGRVPGIVYGGDDTVPFSCDGNKLSMLLQDEAFHSSVVEVNIDGKKTQVLLREVQRHPVRRDILHVDFQEVRADREISANVPLHFINTDTAPGVKLQHGIFTAVENQVAVHCLPKHLPEFIEVDAGMLEIGKSIHLGEIEPPEGVRFDEIVRGNNPALAAVTAVAEEVEPEPDTADGDKPAEEQTSGDDTSSSASTST